MEYPHGSREIRFSSEEEENEQDTKNPLLHPSSSDHAPATAVEREHMFDKVVTPSDVGKLNRLVIPKQYAERYLPLNRTSGSDKGLLLNFEDRNGKPWRFRYSYWCSSQSYVMTKGWSRFVKEKSLHAGDTVSFGRGVGEAARDCLFIDWKRRPELLLDPPGLPSFPLHGGHYHNYPFVSGRLIVPQPPPATLYQHYHQSYECVGNQIFYFPSAKAVTPQMNVQHRGATDRRAGLPTVLDSVPVVHSRAVAKRVRLFGVNLECPDSEDGDDNGNVPPSPQLQSRSPLPHHLQLRLGGFDSS